MTAILRREFNAYFSSPIGYIYLGLLLLCRLPDEQYDRYFPCFLQHVYDRAVPDSRFDYAPVVGG